MARRNIFGDFFDVFNPRRRELNTLQQDIERGGGIQATAVNPNTSRFGDVPEYFPKVEDSTTATGVRRQRSTYNNPRITPDVPISRGSVLSPETSANISDDLESLLDDLIQSQESREQQNSQARTDAINILMGPGGLQEQVTQFYDPLISETQRVVPVNPFSDVMREKLLSGINDQITREGIGAFESAESALASRGLSAGGTTAQTAAGGLQSSLLGLRTEADISTAEKQLAFNTEANLARQELLGKLTGARTGLLSQIGAAAAGIQASDVVDPESIARTISNTYGLQLTREQQQQIMNLIKDMQPTQAQLLIQSLPTILSGFLPSAQGWNAVGTALSNIWGPNNTQFVNPFAI